MNYPEANDPNQTGHLQPGQVRAQYDPSAGINASKLQDRPEKHVALRTEIELLVDSTGNLVCLRDRISQGNEVAGLQTTAPCPPMHTLNEVLTHGPGQIAEARAVMAQIVEEINQSLF